MTFNEYQKWVEKFDRFDSLAVGKPWVDDRAYITKVLGLAGETGEVCEKFKKILRDKDGKMSNADRDEIVKELGDVLWYVATLSRYMGVKFDDVAKMNVEKLSVRKEEGKLMGSGDNR